MVKNGDSEEVIVAKIKAAKRVFDISIDERKDLEQRGVSDTLIKYLQNPELPYTPPPKPVPSSTDSGVPRVVETYPPDVYAAKVPSAVGAYLLQKSDLVPIEIKSLLPERQGNILTKLMPGMSAKVIGVLPGVASRVRVENTPAVFYLRLPDGVKIEDVTIVSLEVVAKEKRRQLEFVASSEKGGKPTVKIDSIRQSDKLAVGPRLYRIATTMLGTGEFMFYLVGSADPANSIQGKGYDFGVN